MKFNSHKQSVRTCLDVGNLCSLVLLRGIWTLLVFMIPSVRD